VLLRRILLLWSLVAICLVVVGGADPRKIGPVGALNPLGLGGGVAVGPVGSAGVDTFKLLIKHSTNHNPDAESLGFISAVSAYDAVDSAASGMKYGYFNQASPAAKIAIVDEIRTMGSVEYNATISGEYRAFWWFDISQIPAGAQIVSAKFVGYGYRGGSPPIDVGSGNFACIRVDTAAADFAVASATSVTSDPHELNACWNAMDISDSANTHWTPSLYDRDDWCDYGVRSDDIIETDVAANETFSIDLTHATQLVVDKGLESSGLLCWLVSSRLTSGTPSNVVRVEAGDNISRYNACLEVVAVTPNRAARPWGQRGLVPFIFCLDDGNDVHYGYAQTIGDSGGVVNEMISGSYFPPTAGKMTQAQYDSLAAWDFVELIPHGATHTSLGSFSTDAGRDSLLRRDWIDPLFTATIDTTNMLDFSYPVGAEEPYLSYEGVRQVVRNGYRASRGTKESDQWSDIGMATPLAWDWFVNTKDLALIYPASLFGADASPDTSAADILDNLNDQIDWHYTWQGKAAIIAYVHDELNAAPASNGCTVTQLRNLMGYINAQPNVQMMTLGQAVQRRLGRNPIYIDPVIVTQANGATAEMEASAAIYDSCGTGWPDSVWVGPR